MVVTTLDTLRFAQTLQAAGIPKKHAEPQAKAFAEVLKVNFEELVTKEMWIRTTSELNQKFVDLENKIAGLRSDLGNKIDLASAKHNDDMLLLKWMLGVSLTVMAGILVRMVFFRLP